VSTIAREGHCGLVLILLALEFVERRVIGVVLRCLGHVALGRDLRPEIAGLYQHDMNARTGASQAASSRLCLPG
jgi:hypothetical protein